MGVEGGTLFLLLAFKVSSQGPWDFVILCFGGNHCTCVGGNSSVLGGLTFHLCSSWVEYWLFLFGMVLEAFHGERGEGGDLQPDTGRDRLQGHSPLEAGPTCQGFPRESCTCRPLPVPFVSLPSVPTPPPPRHSLCRNPSSSSQPPRSPETQGTDRRDSGRWTQLTHLRLTGFVFLS